jgi:hypothetical protein
MHITFTRSNHRDTPALATRPDGVTVRIPVFGPLQPMPHDLAHYVVEREMELRDGFWGSVAAGAVFGGMQILSGRQRPHAADRSREIIAANGAAIGLAEQMVTALMAVVEGHGIPLQPPLSSHRQTPRSYTDFVAQVNRLTSPVEEMIDRWQSLPVGDTLVLQWPEASRQRRHKPRAAAFEAGRHR